MRSWVGGALLGVLGAAGCSDGATTAAADAGSVGLDASRDAANSDASVAADVSSTEAAVDPGVRDVPARAPVASVLVETGVRRERFFVDAPAPPANPTTSVATPAMLNRVPVLRYRSDVTPAAQVQAVVIAMPGFLGGAGSFDPLARALVRRSVAAHAPVEVWAIDRRSNLLEDLRGMDAADALGDPEVAAGYYYDHSVTVGGASFGGYLSATDPSISYMSEWGLASTVADLRAVVTRVPDSRHHVVLIGHSLGATIVEAYAAWDFDGTPGYRSVAALGVLDGVANGTPSTEAAWHTGFTSAFGPAAGVDDTRRAGPFFTALPILGVQALAISEIVGRRAALHPDAVVADPVRDRVLRLLLGVTAVPPMSNAAAMGFSFDDRSCPLAFARMSLGQPVGPVRMAANAFMAGEQLVVPANGTTTFAWTDAPASTPPEFSTIAGAAGSWSTSPTNFSEWYFPSRITLDAAAVGGLRITSDAWQVREGLRVTHDADVDVPVLAVSAALTGGTSAFDGMRARLAPVGSDLPNAGAARTVEAAFHAVFVPGMSHLDAITGADDGTRNPVPGLVDAFARATTAGVVTVGP